MRAPGSVRRRAVAGWVLALLAAGTAVPAPAQARPVGSACMRGERLEACYRRALEAARPALRGQKGGAPAAAIPAALAQLREVCGAGLGDACFFAGRLLVTLAPDTAAARAADDAAALYRRGCDAASPSGAACTGAGERHAMRPAPAGVEADSALFYYRRGCALGSATGCSRQAARLRRHPELGPDRDRWSEEASGGACTRGSPGGCAQALVHRQERLERVPEAGRRSAAWRASRDGLLREYRGLCAQGNLASCASLGRIYLEGSLGVAASPDTARAYAAAACRGAAPDTARGPAGWLGDGRGCATLGALAMRARPPEWGDAIRYYGVGCRLGETDACVELALVSPRTGPSSLTFSGRLFLFLTACAQESSRGCERAGDSYEHDPVAPDTARAAVFYRQACDRAWAEGCMQMARLAWEAREDTAGALKYYRRGCELGSGAACVELAGVLARHYDDTARAGLLLGRGCELGSAAGCWRLMSTFAQARDEEKAGLYRAAACRLQREYCKAAAGADVEARP